MLYHCVASFKQSPFDFFKLVDSQLILMLLYDSLNLIIGGIHQSCLGCWGHRSEKVKLTGLDYHCIQDVQVRCLTERQNYYPQCESVRVKGGQSDFGSILRFRHI